MPMISRKIASTTAAACLVGLAGAAHAEVKIGFITTLSGPGAALGQDQYDAFMLALEQRDGKLGGQAVTVLKEDDQLKPEVGIQIAQRFLQKDKVDVITGVIFSNVMMAIHKPITESKTIFIGSNAGPSPIVGKNCSPYYFSTSWNNDEMHEAGGVLMNQLGLKKVYLLAPNYQAGKDNLAGFKRTFSGSIVDEVYTQVNQADYSAELAAMQAAKPDAVYVFFPGGMGVNFVKQFRQAGLMGKLPMLSGSTIDGSTLPALKDQAVGAITATPYSPDLDNPQNRQFVAYFKKKYGREPSMYAAQSYDAALLLDSALAKVKGNVADKEAFRTALKAADFKSVRGDFSFNTNQFPISNFYRADVVVDGSGIPAFATKATVFKQHKDAYYKDCPMR